MKRNSIKAPKVESLNSSQVFKKSSLQLFNDQFKTKNSLFSRTLDVVRPNRKNDPVF